MATGLMMVAVSFCYVYLIGLMAYLVFMQRKLTYDFQFCKYQ